MKNNKEILNEAFFKKTSYKEKLAQKMPQYEPVPVRGEDGTSRAISGNSAFLVNDIDEVKKRLAGSFGAAFGNNSIKSMANKAIKTFPILVSDNLDPDTVVMIKRLLEEQYAEIINLLVSNQVIDLSAFNTASEEGNIAIQALDTLSGTDFSSTRIADKAAATGKFGMDDIFTNTPLYNLLRENKLEIHTGDGLLNSFLEDSVIVPSEEVETLVEFMIVNAPETLYEFELYDTDTPSKFDSNEPVELTDYLNSINHADDSPMERVRNRRLTNTNILIDPQRMNQALDRTIGEILLQPENKPILERFEKATFLLECGRISGSEYISYLTLRLGIPISKDVRITLLKKYRIADIESGIVQPGGGLLQPNSPDTMLGINRDAINRIATNRRITDSVTQRILRTRIRNALIISGTAGGVTGNVAGAIGGAALANAIGLTGALAAFPPIAIGLLAGVVVSGASLALTRLIATRNRHINAIHHGSESIEGWERVEALIEAMDRQRKDILTVRKDHDFETKSVSIDDNVKSFGALTAGKYETSLLSGKELEKALEASRKRLKQSGLKESLEITLDNAEFTEEELEYHLKENLAVFEEMSQDKEFMAELLEKDITTSMRMKTKYVEKKPGKDLLITPEFAARTAYAYGSTEIDRKSNKDRRYNQPLIMTIKFKERFSDGKYSDNELTAVIGILGKVIRIPSEEMKYILKSNAEGETLYGVLNGGNIKNLVSDLLSTSKISKDIESLPQSADVWKNLEKVATLAATNKYAGKKSNNIANAHIVFSQKEIDEVRTEEGIDYFKAMKHAANLMKKYSAFTLMVANDPGQRVYIYDDLDAVSWNVVPYSALMGKDNGDQLVAALSRLGRM